MQNLSSIRRFLRSSNIQKDLIKKFNNFITQTNSQNFSTIKSESKFVIPEINKIGQEYKNNYQRIQSSIKPKTLNEIKKIQNFVKTTNTNNDMEE